MHEHQKNFIGIEAGEAIGLLKLSGYNVICRVSTSIKIDAPPRGKMRVIRQKNLSEECVELVLTFEC